MSNFKLREVIKQIRACKTAAEERAVISKESALIRNAFKVCISHLLILIRKKSASTEIGTSQNYYFSIFSDTLLILARLNALS